MAVSPDVAPLSQGPVAAPQSLHPPSTLSLVANASIAVSPDEAPSSLDPIALAEASVPAVVPAAVLEHLHMLMEPSMTFSVAEPASVLDNSLRTRTVHRFANRFANTNLPRRGRLPVDRLLQDIVTLYEEALFDQYPRMISDLEKLQMDFDNSLANSVRNEVEVTIIF